MFIISTYIFNQTHIHTFSIILEKKKVSSLSFIMVLPHGAKS